MNRGALQNASLAVLAWLILCFLTSDAIYQKIWGPGPQAAAFAEEGSPDTAPLPRVAKIMIYALPTGVIGGIFFFQWRNARRRRQTGANPDRAN